MDKQSPHLLLRVPTPDRQGLAFCDASPRELKRWIGDLPKANIGETARQLYQGLVELNQLISPSENRLQLLELLRPEVHFVCNHLERHFLNQSIVLDERPRKVANLCQALQNHMAIGYKLIITQELPRLNKERSQLVTIALQRATHALRGPLVRASQLYCPVPEGLWLELHQMYRIARQHGLQRVQVRDELARNGQSLSLEQIYLGALLLGCAGCNQMRQNSIARLAEALEGWSGLACLRAADEPGSLFAIAPQLDGPPRTKALFSAGELHSLLGLDPCELVEALKEHLSQPPGTETPQRLQIPAGMPLELLQHLASTWGNTAERTFQRTQGRGSLFLCIGMSALLYNLAGRRSFNELLQDENASRNAQFKPTEQMRPDVWAGAFDAQRESAWANGMAMEEIQYRSPHKTTEHAAEEAAESYPCHELPIVNHSPGGYCLTWPREVPSQLQAGELLGIQDAPGQTWSVAVVRWIRQVRGGGTQMGIEMIAPHAQPCGVQLVRKNEQNSQYLRALLLPEIRVISKATSLITPRLPFQEGNKVRINHNGHEIRAILGRKQTSTGSFSQFEYRRLDENQPASGTPITASKDPGHTGDEDFDSLWKSL